MRFLVFEENLRQITYQRKHLLYYENPTLRGINHFENVIKDTHVIA